MDIYLDSRREADCVVLTQPESLEGTSECLGHKEGLEVSPGESLGLCADLATIRPLSLFESCTCFSNREINANNNNTFILDLILF